jgi:hypothetical protein
MQKMKLESGLYITVLTKAEQEKIWQEVNSEVYNSTTPFYTPYDKYKYFIVKEVETGYNQYEITIKTNGITKTIKTSIQKQDDKIMRLVRKLNGSVK